MMSMEQLMKQCNREYMKMAMLKHEATFRQQVHELHRLYRIQKQLMKDLKNNKEPKRQRSTTSSPTNQNKPHRVLNLHLPADEYIGGTEQDAMLETEEERELELTLAIGSNRKKRGGGTPLASDSAMSFSSSSTESGSPIGCQWALNQMTNMSNSFAYQMTIPSDVGEGMRLNGLKQPPWLQQCLSLKMT